MRHLHLFFIDHCHRHRKCLTHTHTRAPTHKQTLRHTLEHDETTDCLQEREMEGEVMTSPTPEARLNTEPLVGLQGVQGLKGRKRGAGN